jgi:elongator complex protein 4
MHTVLPASHKHSVLRGLRASSTAGTSSQSRRENTPGTGENNLAFRCTRKRFVIETLHLDAEGGVGERRTNAPPTAAASVSSTPHLHLHARTGPIPGGALAVMALEDTSLSVRVQGDAVAPPPPEEQPRSKSSIKKKRVAFHSDRPDLYDF